MKPLGEVALGEYGPEELWDAAAQTRAKLHWYFENREQTAEWFELFAFALAEIRSLAEVESK